MAEQVASDTASAGAGAGGRNVTRRVVVALAAVLAAQALFALCLVSALQLLAPRNMPFGVVGSSKVVAAVTSKVSLDTIGYADKSAALGAIGRGQLYGAYVTGSTSDTLIVVPAKSFFARIELEGAFLSAAHKLHQPVTMQAASQIRRMIAWEAAIVALIGLGGRDLARDRAGPGTRTWPGASRHRAADRPHPQLRLAARRRRHRRRNRHRSPRGAGRRAARRPGAADTRSATPRPSHGCWDPGASSAGCSRSPARSRCSRSRPQPPARRQPLRHQR